MVKQNLSEYTDRSEPVNPEEVDPRATAERLGAPLIGGGQVRTEQTASTPPTSKVVGVCAVCGLVITSGVSATCSHDSCPTGLNTRQHQWDEVYDAFDNGSR